MPINRVTQGLTAVVNLFGIRFVEARISTQTQTIHVH